MGKEVDPSDIGKFPLLIKSKFDMPEARVLPESGSHCSLFFFCTEAQMEMSRSDILVCGNCNGVYHFVESFVDHKKTGCSTETALRESVRFFFAFVTSSQFNVANFFFVQRETKPKVWAFLLWKASHLNGSTAYSANVNSWKLYQSWIKLDEAVRETWVVAGRTIQSFARVCTFIFCFFVMNIEICFVQNTTQCYYVEKIS